MNVYTCTMFHTGAVIEVYADSVSDAVQRVEKITDDFVVVCEVA